ncbi:MAG TPA: hypothetical protein ENJ37_04940 [Deltaproteobacteria bacterium]|nr:hypothetical protein [Deltaproteobacteria bacterium]
MERRAWLREAGLAGFEAAEGRRCGCRVSPSGLSGGISAAARVLAALGLVLAAAIDVHALSFTFFDSPSKYGYSAWNDPANLATRNAWLAAVGESPDYYQNWEGYAWDGTPWYSGKLFDVVEVPTAVFGGGVTFSNAGPNRNYPAKALRGVYGQLGGAAAIGILSWRGNQTNNSTVYFGPGGADYLGFWIFDIDHGDPVTYYVHFTDGTVQQVTGQGTANRRYRFVGFVNTHPTASFSKVVINAPTHSAFGIDEMNWGSVAKIVEPPSLLVLAAGLVSAALARRKVRPGY